MSIEKVNKLNHLLMNGNPGGLYFSAWLKENGYSDQLIKRYRDSGWLTALTKGVMFRTGDKLSSFSVLDSYNEQMKKKLPYSCSFSFRTFRIQSLRSHGKTVVNDRTSQT